MAAARRAEIAEQVKYRGGEAFVGAYAGSPYTYASDVRFTKPGTDMTVRGIDWEGKPFDNPIYYGARIARWLPASALGGMIDFTHSKAYAPLETQTAQMTGTRDGKPADAVVKLDSLFHKLEFTHGHNMLTLNALLRLPFRTAFLSPYVGIGGGASLPHTEVQFKGGARTYEYQYTGPALQFVAGLKPGAAAIVLHGVQIQFCRLPRAAAEPRRRLDRVRPHEPVLALVERAPAGRRLGRDHARQSSADRRHGLPDGPSRCRGAVR